MVKVKQVNISMDLENIKFFKALKRKGFNLSKRVRDDLTQNRENLMIKYNITEEDINVEL